MLFEGILINKVPYKERDLIVKLLLRNGLMASFYVYGGQGGGKHHKPTLFTPGSLMKIQIKETKSRGHEGQELMIAAEYQRVWEPVGIRHEIRAFYLMCLYFEVLQKLAQPFHPKESDMELSEAEGIFSVASNALFYLDRSLSAQDFDPSQQLSLFMVKLLFHLGIMPDTENCGLCGTSFREVTGVTFQPVQGNFSCNSCHIGENEMGFLNRIRKTFQTRFQDYPEILGTNLNECDKLIHYFCHQFHLKPVDLRSYALLFK